MSFKKRYTIFNLYIRGGNQAPQAAHALNNLWKEMIDVNVNQDAKSLFLDWANNSEVEIMLQGGYHQALEDLYNNLKVVKGLPVAKFNESVEALNGACTVVTFVATDRIVEINNYVRNNHLSPANVVEKLNNAAAIDFSFNSRPTFEEIQVVSKIAFLPLAS